MSSTIDHKYRNCPRCNMLLVINDLADQYMSNCPPYREMSREQTDVQIRFAQLRLALAAVHDRHHGGKPL